ncbi:MAG UNVERIFIED_CONTAM: hypothetical protein LVR18_14340 [Planctomycetaceae bacterium]
MTLEPGEYQVRFLAGSWKDSLDNLAAAGTATFSPPAPALNWPDRKLAIASTVAASIRPAESPFASSPPQEPPSTLHPSPMQLPNSHCPVPASAQRHFPARLSPIPAIPVCGISHSQVSSPQDQCRSRSRQTFSQTAPAAAT